MTSLPSAANKSARLPSGVATRIGIGWRTNLLLTLAAVCVAGLTAYIAMRQQSAERQQRLAEMVERIDARITERMTLFQYGLRGLNGSVHVIGLENLTRPQFERYSQSRDIETEFPGARGFGVIRRVAPGNTDTFIAKARLDHRPEFKLRELSPNAGERWIIQYIAPANANRGAEGLDIASEAMRRKAIDLSTTTGNAILTQPITLVQASGQKEAGFLFMRPIYRQGAMLDTPEQRRDAAIGLTYSPLLITEILGKVDLYSLELSIALDSKDEDGQMKRFYESVSYSGQDASFEIQRPMQLFGVSWLLSVRPTSAFVQRLNHTRPGTIGLMTFMALSALLLVFNLYNLAGRRRLQLFDDQARLAAIVESSNDAIIGKTVEGVVISWNKAAERMFGFTAREAIGRTIADLIIPPELLNEEADILARLGQGQKVSNFVTRRRAKNHAMLDVSVSVSPIFGDDGRIVGAAKTVRDVTEQQRTEREIRELNATLEQKVAQRTSELEDARKSLRTILDAMPSLVGYWDRNCINRFANRSYEQWFGMTPQAIKGKHIRELLGEATYEANLPHIRKVLEGEAQSFERDYPKPGGDGVRHAAIQYLPYLGDDNHADGFYVIAHDVTELIEARKREQMEQAREQQMRFDRLASLGMMVAGVAHEMNTPLGAAMLALDKLSEDLANFNKAVAAGLRKSDVDRIVRQFDEGLAMASRYLSRGAEIIRQFKQVASDRASAERRVFMGGDVIRDVLLLSCTQN